DPKRLVQGGVKNVRVGGAVICDAEFYFYIRRTRLICVWSRLAGYRMGPDRPGEGGVARCRLRPRPIGRRPAEELQRAEPRQARLLRTVFRSTREERWTKGSRHPALENSDLERMGIFVRRVSSQSKATPPTRTRRGCAFLCSHGTNDCSFLRHIRSAWS